MRRAQYVKMRFISDKLIGMFLEIKLKSQKLRAAAARGQGPAARPRIPAAPRG